MDGGAIPDQEQAAFDVPTKVLDELDNLRAFKTALVDLETEPLPRESADDREALPAKAFVQQRCLPAQSPSSHTGGLGAQTAFINED